MYVLCAYGSISIGQVTNKLQPFLKVKGMFTLKKRWGGGIFNSS